MSQMSELARPFPASLIKTKPGAFKAAYVEHAVVVQRLLECLGPFTFRVDELIRDADGVVCGCLATLEVVIDGTPVVIREVGDVEHPSSGNAGGNAKAAASDAIKRCAARLGLGLHLWAGDGNYYLDKALAKRETADE
jgi:hypothetical protein